MYLPPDKLTELDATRFSSSASELREAAKKRRESVRYLERCHATLADKQSRFNAAQERQREREDELEEARGRRAAADQEAEAAGTILVDAWTTHCAALNQAIDFRLCGGTRATCNLDCQP
jgi:chromosome segregation ATPase